VRSFVLEEGRSGDSCCHQRKEGGLKKRICTSGARHSGLMPGSAAGELKTHSAIAEAAESNEESEQKGSPGRIRRWGLSGTGGEICHRTKRAPLAE